MQTVWVSVITAQSRTCSRARFVSESLILQMFFPSLFLPTGAAALMSTQHPLDEWGTTEKPEHQQSTVTVRLHILLFYTLRAPLWSYYYISLSLYCYITPDRPQPRMNSPNEPPVFRSEQCQPTSRSIFSCLYSRQGLFVLWYNTDRIKVAFWYRLVYFP